MRVSCHPPRPRGLFPLHQATFRRAPRIFLFRNHLPRALKRGWLKKSADRGRMRPDNGRSAFDAICLHPHSYSQANRFHGAILAVHRIRIDLTSAPARTKAVIGASSRPSQAKPVDDLIAQLTGVAFGRSVACCRCRGGGR